MENYNNIKYIYGIARLTKEWEQTKESFSIFCKESWKSRGIYDHMIFEYIKSSEPITLRIYELDQENLELLAKYVNWAY